MSCVMMFVCEWSTSVIWTMRSVCVNVPRGCCNGQWVSNGNQFPLTTPYSIFYENGGCICGARVCLWGDVILWCSSQTMITETRQNTHQLKLLDTDSLWLLSISIWQQPQIIRPHLNLPVNHQILLSTSEDLHFTADPRMSTAAQIHFIYFLKKHLIYDLHLYWHIWIPMHTPYLGITLWPARAWLLNKQITDKLNK